MEIIKESKRLRIMALSAEDLSLLIRDPAAFETQFQTKYEAEELNAEQREIYSFMLPGLLLAEGEEFYFRTLYLLLEKEKGIIVASVLFKDLPENGTVEIGYETGIRHQNQGYMSEALPYFLMIAKEHGAKTVIAETAEDNLASKRVLGKSGFSLKKEEESFACFEYFL
ncbi:MAG: GNAT family N-acetyltransferase [Clostridiales bacterium]|nr:GNAT family N-acetyltransferase [Clostridiales bacterium]